MDLHAELIIFDEINVQFTGVTRQDVNTIIDKTKVWVKGANNSAQYQLGVWDGKSSLFNKDGTTYLYMCERVIDILEDLGYTVSIRRDDRKVVEYVPGLINESFLPESGYDLRFYQVDAVNAVIENEQGIIEVATSGGKTLITSAITKAYNPAYRTLVIVPSEDLVKQTHKDMVSNGLETGRVYGKVPAKKRPVEWAKRNVVTTWRTAANMREYLTDFQVVIYDECHVLGDVMEAVLSEELAGAHVRVGLSGTVPDKDKFKKQKLFSLIGGEVLIDVTARELMDNGHISTVEIGMFEFEHVFPIDKDDWDWDKEFDYLCNSKPRVNAIADFIANMPAKNTLVLTHPQLGARIATHLGLDFIDKDVDGAERERYYECFNTLSDYFLVATYGTVGTGLSIDDIYHLVLVDVGKDRTRIIQGIGRGLRKDSQGVNHCKVYDLYASTPISKRHKTDRTKVYRDASYPYEFRDKIKVN